MKRAVFVLPLVVTPTGFLWAGCATQHAHKPAYVAPPGAVVAAHPPTPREAVVGAPPGSNLEWKDGYWVFANWRWVWLPGHWEEHRLSNAAWVPGHWDRRHGAWKWQPGKWESRDGFEPEVE